MMRFHSMISLELIALTLGVALFILIHNQKKIKVRLPIYVAWFVIIISSLSIICSIFYSIKYWKYSKPRIEKMMMYKEMVDPYQDTNKNNNNNNNNNNSDNY